MKENTGQQATEGKTEKLYYVDSILHKFEDNTDVVAHWCKMPTTTTLHPREAFHNYDELSETQQIEAYFFANELFTEDEAKQLIAILEEDFHKVALEEFELPLTYRDKEIISMSLTARLLDVEPFNVRKFAKLPFKLTWFCQMFELPDCEDPISMN